MRRTITQLSQITTFKLTAKMKEIIEKYSNLCPVNFESSTFVE